MDGFFSSFQPLFARVSESKYKLELILICISITTLIITATLSSHNQTQRNAILPTQTKTQNNKSVPGIIYVDVSGAVKEPKVYILPEGSRVFRAVDEAGGFADDVALSFMRRNINLARKLTDQEKIYIPSHADIDNQFIDETTKIIDENNIPRSTNAEDTQPQRVDINTSVLEEIDQLPGVGPVIGNKIINNRPYQTVEELISKKIVSKSVFEKIKELITVAP